MKLTTILTTLCPAIDCMTLLNYPNPLFCFIGTGYYLYYTQTISPGSLLFKMVIWYHFPGYRFAIPPDLSHLLIVYSLPSHALKEWWHLVVCTLLNLLNYQVLWLAFYQSLLVLTSPLLKHLLLQTLVNVVWGTWLFHTWNNFFFYFCIPLSSINLGYGLLIYSYFIQHD